MVGLLLFVVTIIINIFLGLVVFLRDPDKLTNRLFAFLSLTLVGWIATLCIYYLVSTSNLLLLAGRVNFFVAAFIPYSMWLFIRKFPEPVVVINRKITILVSLITFFFAGITLTSLIDKKELFIHGARVVSYGPLYPWYLLYIIVFCSASIILLLVKLLKARGTTKLQLKYLLLGYLSLVVVGITCNGILPYFFNFYALQPFGPFATVLFLGFITYAMVRHRFLDITRIAAGMGVYIVSIIGLGLTYFIVAEVIGRIFFPTVINEIYIIISVIISLFLKYAFTPLRHYFWKVTNKFFFGKLYNRDDFLDKILQTVTTTSHLPTLTTTILKIICSEMQLEKGFLLCITEGEPHIMARYYQPLERHIFSQKDTIALEKMHQIVLVDEIEDVHLRATLKKKNLYLLIPFQVKDNCRGVFCLGIKRSGESFSIYDIQTLQLLLSPISLAFQNAQHIQAIESFNKRLRKEVRSATAELWSVNQHLKRIDSMKDEFISIASHELKTPTTAIKGFLWLILNKDRELSDYSREKIQRVAELTDHLTQLVNDMLDVSKLEANNLRLQKERFDIVSLAKEAKREIEMTGVVGEKQLEIEDNKYCIVYADKRRMQQVLVNLLSNAVKYTPRNGNIDVAFHSNKSHIQIKVSDNGMGIKRSDMKKLFTKFGKIEDKEHPTNLPGTGLGLYICKRIIELSGGTIKATSRIGKGSTFAFTLPKSYNDQLS